MSGLQRQTKRRDIIRRFRRLGWSGPHAGRGSHPVFMRKGDRVVKMPNKHGSDDVGRDLLELILLEAGVSKEEWLGEDSEPDETDQPEVRFSDTVVTEKGRCFRQLDRGSSVNADPVPCTGTVAWVGFFEVSSDVWSEVESCPEHATALRGRRPTASQPRRD